MLKIIKKEHRLGTRHRKFLEVQLAYYPTGHTFVLLKNNALRQLPTPKLLRANTIHVAMTLH